MKRFPSGLVTLACAVASSAGADTLPSFAAQRQLLDQYCVGCHNDKLKTGGLSLQRLDPSHASVNAREWEKVIVKLRAGNDAAGVATAGCRDHQGAGRVV